IAKERPILFNGPMVRAILEGRKTQTRRIIGSKKKPVDTFIQDTQFIDGKEQSLGFEDENGGWFDTEEMCPYGHKGDRLWVRETWWQAGDSHPTYPDDDEEKWLGSRRVHYSADGPPPNEPNKFYPNGLSGKSYSAADPNKFWKKRPSIHMPRWASRIDLEITRIGVERLQDISEEDAKAEGMVSLYTDKYTHFLEFCDTWKEIYGANSWDANPWVWVVKFKRVETTE
uniref:hypothetical protein n=1 Tax=uncultured Microbulbifer sp. TaxID=348147 RepID=UPI00260F1BED